MKIKKFFAQKKPAQAMVEFAIALPVLLMLLYGILEAGRYLFIYSSIITASRQAVRYASATGEGLTTTVARYDDCDGIRRAAKQVDYLNSFTTANITIFHDTGPGTTPTPYCAASTDAWAPTSNKYRILVKIEGNFNPIVPKLVPFIKRTVANGNPIKAEAARSLLYSVPIQVEQDPFTIRQSPVIVTITSHDPNPSEIGETVRIMVSVRDADFYPQLVNIPTGIVTVTGVEGTCIIAVSETTNGDGYCDVQWGTPGDYTLQATYEPKDPDVDHFPNISEPEQHTVKKAQSTLHLLGVSPEGSVPGQPVTFAFNVTGGSTTPTGDVTVDGGGGATCTVKLTGGAGSCVITFNNKGKKTVTISYGGDSTHEGTSITLVFIVSDANETPTPKPTATITPIPSATPTATATLSPTPMPTPVGSCKGVTHGPLKYSGSSMSMTVTNPFPFTLTMNVTVVTWNDDKGHKTGADKTLKLIAAWVNGVPFWTGTSGLGESTKQLAAPASFPPGTSTITFTFDKSYDNPETTDKILIYWLTPGCENDFVDSSK